MERPPGAPSKDEMARRTTADTQQRQQQGAMREAVLFQSLMREQQARNQLEVELASTRRDLEAAQTQLTEANDFAASADATEPA